MKTPIDTVLDGLTWVLLPELEPEEREGRIPYATHEGRLVIGNAELRVFQLNDGRRVIESSDLERFFRGRREHTTREGAK